jgi:diaminopimelate decarboxylase
MASGSTPIAGAEEIVSGNHFAVVRARPSFDEMLGRDTIPDWI